MIQPNCYKNEAESYYQNALSEFNNGHYHQVVGKLYYALHLLDQMYFKDGEILRKKIYEKLCQTYMSLKQYDKAEEICATAISYAMPTDRRYLSFFYNQYFVINVNKKLYYKAMYWHQKVIELLTDNLTDEEVESKARAIYNLASFYLEQYRLDEAKKTYIQLCTLLKRYNVTRYRGKALLGLGYVFHTKNQMDYAERCYLQAKKYISPQTEVVAYGRLMHNLAEIYESVGLIEKAREYFLISLSNEAVYKLDRRRAASSFRGVASTFKDDDINKMYYYCTKAINLMMDNMGIRFSPVEEQELGFLYILFSRWLKFKNQDKDSLVYLHQAEQIFKKYGFSAGLEEVNKIRRSNKGGESR